MHSWFVLILFGSLLAQILSRPQQAEYNNDSDVDENEEEEENEQSPEDFLADDEDSRLIEQEPGVQEDEVPRSRHLLDLTESRYLQRNADDDHLARSKTKNLSDSKNNRNREIREENACPANFNDQPRALPRRRQSNRYIEANDDQQEANQHLTNRDVNKSNRIVQNQGDSLLNKRTADFEGTSNEEGDMLFEKNRDQISKVDKSEYNNNDAPDPSEQSRYFKQYYNAMQADNRDMAEEKSHDAHYNQRDRREAKDASAQTETPNVSSNQGSKENNDKTDTEDEESAIKRHIKKLSGDELDQLLSSLTDEKRELLKKIIDDVDATDNGFINKREITKKAGAVEENNYNENSQSDISKVQGGSPVVDVNTEASVSQNTETTEISKASEGQAENNETAKTAETSSSSVNKVELTSNNDDSIQKKTESNLNTFAVNLDPKNQGEIVANVQVATKTETKRETNLDDLDDSQLDTKMIENELSLQNAQDYLNDQGYFCSQDETLSKLIDDETQTHDEAKAYKREANSDKQPDLSDSIKSLEESFPNSNTYDDAVPYSGPLVRVKRKNSDRVIKKRGAALMPDTKVAFFPYKAENEDEDNDEGNEFDDEGFYDRTSNFANSNKGVEEDIANSENSPENKNMENVKGQDNLEGESSLGSDTDNVLSGVEGADDNLMYSSGVRNRRTAEDNSSGPADVKSERSTSLVKDEKVASENFYNAPHYQENDSFGPLPRSYDGDLARYKRIRRVKQSHNAQDINSSDG
ncbi:RNA polymerase-associated protein LEO1-like isoform X1 [Trichoplusia ni]|nr:RNA polymerase-associated protein LEO1-like isoform X1 [Trichoplusia ni]